MRSFLLSHQLCEQDEWMKWIDKIPYIKFPKEWEIKAIPPFMGAIIRYKIKVDNEEVSIYLDCYDQLGCFGEPYWEVHPYHGNIGRCAMNDTKKLLELINDRTPGDE